MNPAGFFRLLPAAAVLLSLGACPNPITGGVLRQMSDKTAPSITISSPQDNSPYTQTVTVQGSIQDLAGELREVGFVVAGTLGILQQGTVPLASVGANGDFSFQFDTVSFNGPIVVTVAARDWNDNQATRTITLSYPGSSVSSFLAAPSSKRVDLSWQGVAGAIGYTLYYTTNGTLPSESYGSRLDLGEGTTSVPLSGLKNGALHIFLLRARMPQAPDYWSGYVRAIPLSPLTLAPLVRGGYREISLEWARIEATEEFEVLRATSEAGPYENYTGLLRGYSFTDSNVAEGTWYYYKVKPALEGSILSTYNAAQTVQVPPPAERITSLTLPHAARKVRLAGSYAYVAAGEQGLMVVDVGDPAAPEYVRTIPTTNAQDLAIATIDGRTYLFLADGASGMRVFDLSSPSNPNALGSYATGINNLAALALAYTGSMHQAFLIDVESNNSTTLMALNVSNPVNPSAFPAIGTVAGGIYRFQDIEASFYSSWTFLYLVSLNTSTNASELREYYQSGGTINFYNSWSDPDYDPSVVALSGSYAYVLATRNMDIEPPPEYCLFVLGKYPAALAQVGQTAETSGYASDLRVSGGKAYAADQIGLQVYNVSSPGAPVKSEFLDTPGTPRGVDTDGSYAFLCPGLPLFQVVDLRLPGGMSIAGSYGAAGGLRGLAVRGNMVYAAGSNSLQRVGIGAPAGGTPASPVGLGSHPVSGALDVALSGPYAFVAAGSGGITVLDVSGTPSLVGSVAPISSYLERVAIKGDYLYAASGSGLQVYDVSNPAQPVGIGIYDSSGGGMQDVELRGERAYTTDGAYFQPNSLKVLDVSQPAIPALAGNGLGSGGVVGYLSLYGDWAFVSDAMYGAGLWAVNVNPASPSYMSAYGPCDTLPGAGDGFDCAGVAAFGGQAYILDPTAGLVLVDVSNPAALSNASLVTSLALGSSPADLILDGRYALATDAASGLRIVKLFP